MYEIDHKKIAKHFGKTTEAMRRLKRAYESADSKLWTVYVRAYYFDKKTNIDTQKYKK